MFFCTDPHDAGDKALREELLSAIKANNSDEAVEKALRALSNQNPTRAPAKSDKLFGKWKLLWASPNSEVAKATRRNPLPSFSEQLIGVQFALCNAADALTACMWFRPDSMILPADG